MKNETLAKQAKDLLAGEIGKVIIGKEREISLLLAAVFSGGHILLDDLPGSGKTTLIKALSRAAHRPPWSRNGRRT